MSDIMKFVHWWKSEPHRDKYGVDHPAFLAAKEAWDYKETEMEQKIATMTRSWFTPHNQVALMQNDKTYILSVDDFIAKAQDVDSDE